MEKQDSKREDRLRRTLERDLALHQRRATGPGGFWRAIAVIGMVGWPIALLTVGGAFLGHWIDHRYASGVRFTLMLLTIGAFAGSAIAWNAINVRSGK